MFVSRCFSLFVFLLAALSERIKMYTDICVRLMFVGLVSVVYRCSKLLVSVKDVDIAVTRCRYQGSQQETKVHLRRTVISYSVIILSLF